MKDRNQLAKKIVDQATSKVAKKVAKSRQKDPTGAKRQAAIRSRKERVEALLEPAEHDEVKALIESGVCKDKADAVRQALHEKYLRWVSENS